MNRLFFFFIAIIIYSCSSTRLNKLKEKYFDENDIEISKSEYFKIRQTKRLLPYKIDSLNHNKLTHRIESGNITNVEHFYSKLEKNCEKIIDSTKPVVIIFYPGKDKCNSSGNVDKEFIKRWYGELEKGLKQIVDIKPIYLYKNYEGLKVYEKSILNWQKDKDAMIENIFFKYHYPCFSFVVISTKGEYLSYFGEFNKEKVWEAVYQLKSR